MDSGVTSAPFGDEIKIVDRSTANPLLGARFRSFRQGPELSLIEDFLSRNPFRVRNSYRITIFREPRIDSGSPDLVIVVWKSERTEDWPSARLALVKDDFRLMHYLSQNGSQSQENLVRTFGRRVTSSIVSLSEAQMIQRKGSEWKARPLSRTFSARHIIAIEAKISKTLAAVEQAILNTWFASDSYVLFPSLPDEKRFLAQASHHGIRFLELEQPKPLRCLTHSEPRSYASWMFNDWAWRFESL